MAHRRAASRPRVWVWWLLVPVALALDLAAAVNLTGQALPGGVTLPEGVLVAVPFFVYGALVFIALPTRSIGGQLGATAVLLGIHAGLVALHTVCYVSLWSLPVPAALRLAHRWSPLIPLLQLVWVPLLALPLATVRRRRPPPVAPRRSSRVPVEVLVSRASHAGSRRPTEPDRDVPVVAHTPRAAPVAPVEVVTTVELEPGPSAPTPPVSPPLPAATVAEESAVPPIAPVAAGETLTTAPAPTWFDELVQVSARALPSAEGVDEAAARADLAAMPVAAEPVTVADAPPAMPEAAEPVGDDRVAIPTALALIAESPASPGDTLEDELPRAADLAPAMEAAASDVPAAEASRTRESPLDLDRVARLFAPYGPLLSRERSVVVDWTPSPDAAVVCVAPRQMSRDRVVNLAASLARALGAAEAPSALGPVRRLSLRGPDGCVVLMPLDGAVLVAASRRRGTLALLEVLSARVVPTAADWEAGGQVPDATPAALDAAASGAIRVETPTALLDVLAPAGVVAASMGVLAGRLLAAIAAVGAEPGALHTLSVDLGVHRLMVHPVHPEARPPRFVAVVGGPERPGLLGRRAERAARTLREAS